MPAVEELLRDVAIPSSAIGAAVWLFWRLFVRSDRREKDAFQAVRQQRDEWRERAEAAETDLVATRAELARCRARQARYEDDQ